MRDKIAALLVASGKASYVKLLDLKKDDIWTANELINLASFTNTRLAFTDCETGYALLPILEEDI